MIQEKIETLQKLRNMSDNRVGYVGHCWFSIAGSSGARHRCRDGLPRWLGARAYAEEVNRYLLLGIALKFANLMKLDEFG